MTAPGQKQPGGAEAAGSAQKQPGAAEGGNGEMAEAEQAAEAGREAEAEAGREAEAEEGAEEARVEVGRQPRGKGTSARTCRRSCGSIASSGSGLAEVGGDHRGGGSSGEAFAFTAALKVQGAAERPCVLRPLAFAKAA